MSDLPDILLPDTLGAAVRAELARTFRAPRTDVWIVTMNAALMIGAWTLLPAGWQDWLFTLHGPPAFAMIMAGWMYADVPATNVLASDPERTGAALADRVMINRIIVAKNIALWCLVTPVCTVVALGIGLYVDNWPPTILSVVVIVAVPAGALGVASWLGILFPYHPIPLRDRWAEREHRLRRLIRWMTVVLVPYGLVPVVAGLILLPSLLLWHLISPDGLSKTLPTEHYAAGVALAVVVSAAVWYLGHLVGLRLIRRRQAQLAAYLADPSLG